VFILFCSGCGGGLGGLAVVSFLLWCLLDRTRSISGSVRVLLGGGGAPVLELPKIWFFVGVLVLWSGVVGVGSSGYGVGDDCWCCGEVVVVVGGDEVAVDVA
jgi:hypothetical protein